MNCDQLPKVMISMARTRSQQSVLNSIVQGVGECPNVALARIWLLSNGDICDTCHFHDECPDQTHCLHLVASAGNPRGRKKDYSRLVGDFRRFPLGVRKIGRVAATGEPLLLENVQANENWIVNPKWTKSQHIQSFAAQPLIYHDEILGVLGIFDRSHLSPSDFEWIRIVADHAV